ncbi:MAG: 50S ribosomal protein L11 methyltransferase [Bacteroidales bacterium]|jgi:ribosomal protein L11 methyltransferase|nr:50S ribosomal protein L11 methyltransferase [Bacteroidales bacterium]MDD2263795.1 50S ribosomal protein L11 methyltransferase [Bacteroidales bacterium]MDD2830987.1 50S ribosomal protein L11 methyltransferase [Bacteroidales bacterium]MDD3208205.1 50S ribosomal protein L11 methyltransferase [Bacteroidales bacterium]MDD3696753.1 50S ribosomal protein L11 methyltransferase [Bacteroidales bacterium]
MDHIAVSIVIEPYKEETEEILTAELSAIGYEGFLSETPILKAYIPAAEFRESHLRIILESYDITDYSKEFVAEKNWNADWESRFSPIIIKTGKGCSVRAPGKETMVPIWPPVKWRLVIRPELSFGTGHHPTTYMMMESLLELEQEGLIKNRYILDLGCGTGILAILTAKMDAAVPVHAVDNDRRAVYACRENVRRNRITHKIVVKYGDASLVQINRYGLILANIHRNILIDEMDTLARGLCPEPGHLLLSGFYTADVSALSQAAQRNGLSVFSLKEKEGWALLHLIKSTKS